MDQTRALTTQRGENTQRVSVYQRLPMFVKLGLQREVGEKLEEIGAKDSGTRQVEPADDAPNCYS